MIELLILYFSLAVGISFICSILEAVILSVSMSYVSVLSAQKPRTGKLLKKQKQRINQSVAAILILNTIAHTLGAASVGAQAEVIYGSQAVFYVSVILTLAILFASEIIPKTIGATYWKELAPLTAYSIRFLVWFTYPLIIISEFVTGWITRNKKNNGNLTKEELLASALISEDEGVIDEQESDVIENVLRLDDIRLKEILTPRSVVFSIDADRQVAEVVESEKELANFSRIPVYSGHRDQITGVVLTRHIFEQAIRDDSLSIGEISREIFPINENIPVSKALDLFVSKKQHMFVVVDNYDQLEGIVTLEDCIETLLGIEIMDESDDVEDMRELAKQQMKSKRQSRLIDKSVSS